MMMAASLCSIWIYWSFRPFSFYGRRIIWAYIAFRYIAGALFLDHICTLCTLSSNRSMVTQAIHHKHIVNNKNANKWKWYYLWLFAWLILTDFNRFWAHKLNQPETMHTAMARYTCSHTHILVYRRTYVRMLLLMN